jgi:ureidoglycolate dehydrogenase (NAD+)
MSSPIIIMPEELSALAGAILAGAGSAPEDADRVAASLVWADLRGRHAQGVFRLGVLVEMLEHGIITSPAAMSWSGQAPAVAHLDAANGFGQVAGALAMQRAIEIAKVMGIGMVTVNHSNHYGAAAYYTAMAAEAGCAGFTTSNATPKAAPYGGTKAVYGTNPISFGCPAAPGTPVLVDFATSAIAGSSIRAIREKSGALPEGAALDARGVPTTDPIAAGAGSLLPAAGPKGSGLALMAEILSAILPGAGLSREIGPLYDDWERRENCGHWFLAIDIAQTQPMRRYPERMDDLIGMVKESSDADPSPVRYPGELRGALERRYAREGIPIDETTAQKLERLARRLRVDVPWQQNGGWR